MHIALDAHGLSDQSAQESFPIGVVGHPWRLRHVPAD